MRIDNSAANDHRVCPWLYYEKYEKEGTGLELIQKDEKVRPMDLGTRVHELLEEHYRTLKGEPREPYLFSDNEPLEEEAQWIYQAYRAHYPIEDFKVLDVERTFEVALPDYCPKCFALHSEIRDSGLLTCLDCGYWDWNPGRHTYTGKIDVLYEQNGELYIMDHKTEKRTAKSNLPQKWAARDQGTQYLWAAEKIYGKPINRFIVNVIRRPSPAGREGPEFPERQRIERTEIQIDTALRDLVYEADLIEKHKATFGEKPWPAHRENCFTWGQCEFYQPHLYGWSDAIRRHKYQNRKPYLDLGGVQLRLDLGGVPIIQ